MNTETRTTTLKIIWQGGSVTDLTMAMNKTGGHTKTTDEDTVDLVRRLANDYNDTTIAMILSGSVGAPGLACRSPSPGSRACGSPAASPAFQPPEPTVGPEPDDVVVVTVAEAERVLGVGKVTIYRWLAESFLTGEQLTPGAPWRIRTDPAVGDRLSPEIPRAGCGWPTPPRSSASPARPCCTSSSAASSRPSTSPTDDEKAYVST